LAFVGSPNDHTDIDQAEEYCETYQHKTDYCDTKVPPSAI